MYTVWDHNLNPQEAEQMASDLKDKPLSAFVVTQRARHLIADAETCWACRRDIARASGLEPKPRFKRKDTA